MAAMVSGQQELFAVGDALLNVPPDVIRKILSGNPVSGIPEIELKKLVGNLEGLIWSFC